MDIPTGRIFLQNENRGSHFIAACPARSLSQPHQRPRAPPRWIGQGHAYGDGELHKKPGSLLPNALKISLASPRQNQHFDTGRTPFNLETKERQSGKPANFATCIAVSWIVGNWLRSAATFTFANQVGQHQAREAAGLIVELIRNKRMAGKALLIAGGFQALVRPGIL